MQRPQETKRKTKQTKLHKAENARSKVCTEARKKTDKQKLHDVLRKGRQRERIVQEKLMSPGKEDRERERIVKEKLMC